jgi:hypothetical protein
MVAAESFDWIRIVGCGMFAVAAAAVPDIGIGESAWPGGADRQTTRACGSRRGFRGELL